MSNGTVLNAGSGGNKIYDVDPADGFHYCVSALALNTGSAASTLVSATNPVPSKLGDGTNAVAVKAASTAAVATDPSLVVAIHPLSRSVSILGNTGGVLDSNGSAPTFSLQVGGTVSTAATSPTPGNIAPLSIDASGFLRTLGKVTDGTNTAAVKAASTAAVAADPALVVAISPNNLITVQEPSSTTAGICARQTVGVASGSILASNTGRRRAIVTNVGIYPVYLGLGQTPTTTAYHVALSGCANSADDGSGGTYVIDVWDGAINAISTNAAGAVCVVEMT